MSKAKKFILNTIILTVTSLALRTVFTAFGVYLSRKIGTEGMGLYKLIMSVYMFAVTLATSGIGLTTTRLVAEELANGTRNSVKAAMLRCMLFSLTCSISAAALLYHSADFIIDKWLHGRIAPDTIYALCISLPFLAMSTVLTGYFTAVRRVVKSSSAQFLEQLVRISLTVYLLNLLLPKGINYACLAIVLGGAVAEILSFLYLYILYVFDKRRYKSALRTDSSLTDKMLSISVPVALSSYIRSGLSTFKQMIIPAGLQRHGLSVEAAMSQYGIISGMVMPVIFFPSAFLAAISSLIIPEIAESAIQRREGRISYMISRVHKSTLLFSVGVSGIFFFYAEDISMMLYQSPEAGMFIRSFSPIIVVMYLDDIVDAILKGLNEQVTVVGIGILDSLISIALLYTLLPLLGIRGYVIAFIICEIINASLSIGRLIKVSGFRINPIGWVFLPYVCIIAASLITKIIVPGNLLLSLVTAATLYLLFLFLTSSITFDDFKLNPSIRQVR